MSLLALRNIDVDLSGVSILRDISFEVEPGQTFGIVGPNGAGKTTILNVISGLVHPIGGDVVFKDSSILGVTPHRVPRLGIGRSLQSTSYFADLTVLNLVALGGLKNSVWGALTYKDHRRTTFSPRARRSEAMESLELLGLERYANRPLHELSTAVQKLVDMARALAVGTDLLLLDEPTSGVSAKERRIISDALTRVRSLGRAVVLIDHDPGFVIDNCERLMAMNFGRVLHIGEPGEVMASPEVKQSYLGAAAE
ncbi:MAG: ATP-binding cassette domain-containing protein [Aeromicrobium sp.]